MSLAGLSLLAAALLLGLRPRPVAGSSNQAVAADAGLRSRRQGAPARRGSSEVDRRELALVLDLVAGALGAGLAVDAAIAAVTSAVSAGGDPALTAAVAPLARVGRLISWGADPITAWGSLAQVPGCDRVAAAGRRCADSGARLAGALVSAGDQLRADRHSAALAAAQRVGVWSLLPLGLCFLPAFVCIGIVPVIGGLTTRLLGSGL